jgi:hypothetical protein
MKRLRLATQEEIEAIKDSSDLDVGCSVLALDTQQGTAKAVIRSCIEVDPVYFPDEMNDKLKMFFGRDIETHLEAKGVTHYYFNVACDQEEWQKVVETWGAQRTSKVAEFRYKKIL